MNTNNVKIIAIICISGLIAWAMWLYRKPVPTFGINADGGLFSYRYYVNAIGPEVTKEIMQKHTDNLGAMIKKDAERK